MAAGVSITDLMLLLLLLLVLHKSLTFPNIDPYWNYTCPLECACYKVNETTVRPSMWLNCTVSHISTQATALIRHASNPLIEYAFFNCADYINSEQEVPPESTLWTGAFQKASHLKALVFNHCRFKTLSKNEFRGLSSLTELVFRNAAIDDLDPDLLTYLPQLRTLEISNIAITQLSPLCSSGMLRVLNISRNYIASMEDAGLQCSSSAISRLETLDLSSNILTEIPQWLSHSLPNLYHLGVANNLISRTDYSTLQNLHKLAFLDLHNNSISNFYYNSFKDCSNLHHLDLSMNKISTFPRGLLANLSLLRYLVIGDMDLDDNAWMEISELRELVLLDMSRNRLTAINTDVLSELMMLEQCYLNNNRLTLLPRAVFEYLTKLNSLDLSYNQLTEISPFAFRNQYVLKHLHLHHNKITTIGNDAFSQLKDLLNLDISQNSISVLSPTLLDGLTKVEYFDISWNNLTVISPDLFTKTQRISFLNISHNILTELPVINQLLHLKIIDISFNRVPQLNPSFLLDLRELTTVIISHNELTTLPIKLFKGCESVKTIDLSYNFIKLLDETTFSSMVRVQTIDLSHNEITDITTAFSGLKDLEVLDLSYNNVDKVLRGQFPHLIKQIKLRGNKITYITAYTFKSLSKIRTVDLSENKLTSLNRMDIEIAFNMGHNPVFNLEFNPFVCDCRLGWLKDWSTNTLKDTLTLPAFYLEFGLGCSSPFHKGRQTLQQLSRAEFMCRYTTHCEKSCVCCDYACYCKYVCPTSCRCFIGDNFMYVHQVQCSSINLTDVPSELPEGATDLRLDGNNIQVLHRHEFLALKQVQSLYLNNSQINIIQNNTFKGLKSVRFLYLNDNTLTTIFSVTFQGLDSLEELFLQNNVIYYIDFQALLIPPLLRLVNIQGNVLSSFPMDELSYPTNRTLTSGVGPVIYLSGNPFQCDVDVVCRFLPFVEANPYVVGDVSNIECVDYGGKENSLHTRSGKSLISKFHDELCGVNKSSFGNMTWQNLNGLSSNTETYALIAACVVVAFTVTFIIAAYSNRHLIQVLFFSRFGFRVFRTATSFEDNERPYDAFISYSNRDEDFVLQQLAPRLESGESQFKLCVHYQDFPVGVCLAETIVRSMEASRRTIVVLSDNYIDSEWCRFECQTAHQHVMRDRHNRLIIVILNSLNSDKIDETLKVYLRTHEFLKYDDPWFWQKLIFAMPDISHRKSEIHSGLESSRDLEFMTQEMSPSHQHQWHLYPQLRGAHSGSHCENVQDMYEIPALDSLNAHYHLAHTICCSNHSNTAYHNSGCSDSTSGYHKGSVIGSFCHYEEVGPGSSSAQSTPQKQIGTPPPLPSIPKEGFVPRQKLVTVKV